MDEALLDYLRVKYRERFGEPGPGIEDILVFLLKTIDEYNSAEADDAGAVGVSREEKRFLWGNKELPPLAESVRMEIDKAASADQPDMDLARAVNLLSQQSQEMLGYLAHLREKLEHPNKEAVGEE